MRLARPPASLTWHAFSVAHSVWPWWLPGSPPSGIPPPPPLAAAPAASADRKRGATRFSISRGVGELGGERLCRRTDPCWHGDRGLPGQRDRLLFRDRSPRWLCRERAPLDPAAAARRP